MKTQLASEAVVISAPMSFHGSAARIWKITAQENAPVKWLLLVPLALLLVAIVWWCVLCWYVIFGIALVPYRLLRRGSRKRKMEGLRHRELLTALDKEKS